MAALCAAWGDRSSRILAIPYQILNTRFAPLPVRRLKFVQRAAQRFKLAFVGKFLVLGRFHQPQHFLHLLQRLLQ